MRIGCAHDGVQVHPREWVVREERMKEGARRAFSPLPFRVPTIR